MRVVLCQLQNSSSYSFWSSLLILAFQDVDFIGLINLLHNVLPIIIKIWNKYKWFVRNKPQQFVRSSFVIKLCMSCTQCQQQILDMQAQEQIHPNGSILDLVKLKPNKNKIITNQSSITIRISTINLVIHGNRNRIKIEDSAGRVTIEGNENQVEIKKSWMACELEGNANLFALVQAQFQLKRHQGVGNYIPGVLGQNPVQMANRRLLLQQRYINLRLNSQRQNSKNIKKYWPNLIKSKYNSENRECPICYDDIKNEDEVTSLFCFHLFHSTCIEACLQTTTKCPVCSLDILSFIKQQVKAGNYICKEDELLMKQSMQE